MSLVQACGTCYGSPSQPTETPTHGAAGLWSHMRFRTCRGKEPPCLLAKLVSGEIQGFELSAGPLLWRWQCHELVSL